jgi:hypothetical protein
VRARGRPESARVQFDVKAPVVAWTDEALQRIADVLGDIGDRCVVSAYDWTVVRRWSDAVPGLHPGFDPLDLYPRSLELSPLELEQLPARVLAVAPGARIYYLEARLVLAGLERGVNLIRALSMAGAEIDVWTIDADRAGLNDDLRRVIDAGCHQITSNDPVALARIVAEIVAGARRC